MDIIDILKGEQLFGNLLWSDIVKGAELLYNLIDCIQVNVQGKKDEESLETEARNLLKENRFLAGVFTFNEKVKFALPEIPRFTIPKKKTTCVILV